MKKILQTLRFTKITNPPLYKKSAYTPNAYLKIYPGFRLWVSEEPSGEYSACLEIGKTEILIPGSVDEGWIKEFDKEHIAA